MFTGIIEEVGVVRQSDAGRLVIEARRTSGGTNLGDSIAINGVDLTVALMDEESFTFNVMPETYRRSNLGQLAKGDPVNLERSLTLASRLSGHLVRGVVEGTGRLASYTPEADAILARYAAPTELMRYVVVKGPIAVDGVSLTVVERDESSFVVSLVAYTQQNTNLTRRKVGDAVNLETDIIARYVEQLLGARLERQ
ncbi:MAG: riboflavin synthase [Dehalococcoidia bacterium]|jgi:riboflavin synthase